MRLSALTLFVALAAAGCASSGPGGGAPGDDTVQITLINEYVGTVTAYAVWGTSRVRLGDVGQNRTRMFFTRVQGNPLVVGLEVIGAPPAGTRAGPTRFGALGGSEPDPSAPYVVSGGFDVIAGDALEFRFRLQKCSRSAGLGPDLRRTATRYACLCGHEGDSCKALLRPAAAAATRWGATIGVASLNFSAG